MALAGQCEKDFMKNYNYCARCFYVDIGEGEQGFDSRLLFLHTLLRRYFYLKVRGKIPGSYSIIGTSSMDFCRGRVVHIHVCPVCLPTSFERVHQYWNDGRS